MAKGEKGIAREGIRGKKMRGERKKGGWGKREVHGRREGEGKGEGKCRKQKPGSSPR